MKIFITGLSGFVGGHLARHLLAAGHEVAGVGLTPLSSDLARAGVDRDRYRLVDLVATAEVREMLRKLKPEAVVHLAGLAAPRESEEDPYRAFRVNTAGTLSLMEALSGLEIRLALVVSTSSVYSGSTALLTEGSVLGPRSLYGLTKLQSEMIARFYHEYRGVPATILRPFNQIGPSQDVRFVLPNFARQVARIEKDPACPAVIHVGNLSGVRDWTDIRDMVRAYEALLTAARPGESYNLCSGQGVPVQRLLDLLLSECHRKVEVVKDDQLLREEDESVGWVGDNLRLRERTGWKPEIPLPRTVHDVLEEWRGAGK